MQAIAGSGGIMKSEEHTPIGENGGPHKSLKSSDKMKRLLSLLSLPMRTLM
jgi:hypothetical protein